MYTPPSLDSIIEDLRNSVKAEVAGTDPWIWPNNLVPVLKAVAQVQRAGYLRLEWVHDQAFATTASGYYLDWHGIQAGGLSRNPPGFAQGEILAYGLLGTFIEDGTLIARNDGVQFVTVGSTNIIEAPQPLFCRAVAPGELPNTDSGATFVPLTPISGLENFIVGADGILGGKEQENDVSFRQRILFYKQNPPHGGSPAEYIEWAQTKLGVTRVFVKRATPGPGSVTIYFMMDGIGTGIPSAGDVAQLHDILTQIAPSDADIIVAAPTPVPIDVEVSALQPDTPAMQDAVTNEIRAMFLRRAEPGPSVFARAWLDEACSMAPGWRRSGVTIPTGDIEITTPGEIPVLGDITFAFV